MSNETGKQLIKSATAVLCVAGICISAVISTNKVADMIKATATSSQVQEGGSSYNGDSIPTDEPIIDNNTGTDTVTDAAGTDQTDAAQPDSTQAGDTGSGSSQTGSGTSGNKAATKPSASKQMSKAEIINYCNTALNKAKAAKVGYNKKMVREVKGSTDGTSLSSLPQTRAQQ